MCLQNVGRSHALATGAWAVGGFAVHVDELCGGECSARGVAVLLRVLLLVLLALGGEGCDAMAAAVADMQGVAGVELLLSLTVLLRHGGGGGRHAGCCWR